MRLVMGSESTSTPSQSKSTASKKSLAIGRENEWFLEQARIPHEAVNCAFRVCSGLLLETKASDRFTTTLRLSREGTVQPHLLDVFFHPYL